MSWQERRCNAEGFGKPEPFFFLCEERTYSPPRRSKLRIVRFRLKPKAHSLRCFSFPRKAGFAGAPWQRWYAYGNVRSPRGISLSAESDRQFCILCGCCIIVGADTNYSWRLPAKTYHRQLFTEMGGTTPPIFSLRKRNRNGGERRWRSIIWKQRL